MKKLIIVSCMLMVVNFGFAQNNTRLKGPAAKNAKPWTKKSKKSKLVYAKHKKMLKGPAAKNAKPWNKNNSNLNHAKIESSKRPDIKGPKAKNFKPWMLPATSKTDNMAHKNKGNS